ncbi:thiamine phosphate synthase [Rhodomicrobium vannielii ATCC 17100]|uniref:thiamine phosphate synthase n=1 Tax=Rhodomicrobium vannielii TaxID=1069 RepID=UPI00191812C5|nr:thiamine phosphate synthase [Rhodomicrobium vannielii]MBJ7535345.1 thiamine phosphate synthase [Rhodomicrobium vannielii ATCC 17100]
MTTALPRFYPVVPDVTFVERFARVGVKLIQLRMKDADASDIAPAITQALEACRVHGAALVVNDHWREAIDCGAPWVHLGQGDLDTADVAAIRRAGLKLGLSTHSHEELDRALSFDPDYIALGPVYQTTLKVMPWAPQGLARVGEWKALAKRPLVAIGGITLERAPDVYGAGADSIAVVSDVVFAPDPEARAKDWLALAEPGNG